MTFITVLFLTLTYALVLAYVGLMLLVIRGMLRAAPHPRSEVRPPVSVVIPAHNEEDDLPATLASLRAQRYAGELEFVIVNDRSEDATERIVREAAAEDPRVRLVNVAEPSRRLAPKVNAVDHGIRAARGEIILASDADCLYPEGWIEGMISHFEDDVTMVVGYVESTRAEGRHRPKNWTELFETTDWFTLMVTSRSLTHFGWKFASSANNQAYRKAAFEAAGGFGASGRAPSGDEDLLTQRLGRLPGSRIVFASSPETRVLTRPMSDPFKLLRQRRRWVSRYHHVMHYHPGFVGSIAVLGFQSVFLSIGILLSPFVPAIAPWIFGLWGLKLTVELVGMNMATRQLDRRDLWPLPTAGWALLHPFFIATVVIWSFIRPGDWRAGARSYRSRFFKRQLREWRRKLVGTLLGL